MLTKNRYTLVVLGALALAALACNAGLTPGGPAAPTALVESTPVGDAAPAGPTQPGAPAGGGANPADLCPQPDNDTTLFRSDEDGYCFLYPADFEENPNWTFDQEGMVVLISPFLDPEAVESIVYAVEVMNNGPAGEIATAEQYADAWLDAQRLADEPVIQRSTATIGAQPALVVSSIPGRTPTQSAFIVAGGQLYRISIQPQPGSFEQLDAAYGGAWETITQSIVFYPPTVQREVVGPEDVCSQATADTFLHVNRAEGYCFLVPAAFEEGDEGGSASSWLVSGPFFDTGTEMGEMQARVVFSWFGPSQGKTAMELTDGFVAESGAPRQEVNMAGGQAVELIDPRGPVPSRTLMLVTNDNAYTLVTNPYDASRWPEATALQDQAWDSILSTLAFFDKLR